MIYPITNIIIEGVDRLGKDSLIDGIQQRLGFFEVLHYKKPQLLDIYIKEAHQNQNLTDESINISPEHTQRIKSYALKRYQQQSFTTMFQLLSMSSRLILNRSHIGEAVYASRYRKYDGNYVFDLEEKYINDHGSMFHKTTLLVLLHTSSFDFIVDDGMSHDFSAKEEEQNDFIRAFERSNIQHKVMIDVHDGCGSFVDKEKIINTVLTAITDLPQMQHPNWYVTWHRENGILVRDNFLSPDPKKTITV